MERIKDSEVDNSVVIAGGRGIKELNGNGKNTIQRKRKDLV